MANHRRDLAGEKFGRLTAVEAVGTRDKRVVWRCAYDCGATKDVPAGQLTRGQTKSCGCLLREAAHTKRHCMSKSAEWRTWRNLRVRCNDPKDAGYKNYGGRGIRVCARWDESFEAFMEDMGPRPDGCSIERVDNNGHYEPGNCIWAPSKVQARNRRTNRMITANGVTKSLVSWSDETGIKRVTIAARLRRGMTPEQALGMENTK